MAASKPDHRLLCALGTLGLLVTLMGCGGTDGDKAAGEPSPSDGRLVMVVKWPQAEATAVEARAIPPETELLRAIVTATDIAQPIVGECTKDDVVGGEARIELDVPSGTDRHVLAQALDATAKVLTSGEATVDIVAGQANEVHIVLSLEPVLSVFPTTLDFGATQTSLPLHIRNAGGGTLNWALSPDKSWISVSPSSGTNDADVTVTVDRAGLSPGPHAGMVTVDAGASGKVDVSVLVTAEPGLSVSPARLDFGTWRRHLAFDVDPGDPVSQWTLVCDAAWATCDPADGGTGPGRVEVFADRSRVPAAEATGEIIVRRQDGAEAAVDLHVAKATVPGTLAFARYSQNRTAVFRLANGNLVKLVDVGGNVYDLEWSPDGAQLAMEIDHRLYIVTRDGAGFRELLPGATGLLRYVSWSPDGQRVVTNAAPTDTDSGETVVFDVNTGAAVDRFSYAVYDLAWSPNGRYIAGRTGYPSYALVVIDTVDGSLREVARPPDYAVSHPVWKQGGQELLFGSRSASGRETVAEVRLDGSGLRMFELTEGHQLQSITSHEQQVLTLGYPQEGWPLTRRLYVTNLDATQPPIHVPITFPDERTGDGLAAWTQ